MIYSKWKPSKGGYDYYQSNEKDIPLGNDLPVPVLPAGTDIGVASIDCGRPIPMGSKRVGSGTEPAGMIAPTEHSAVGALTSVFPTNYLYMAAGVFAGWLVFTKKVKLW